MFEDKAKCAAYHVALSNRYEALQELIVEDTSRRNMATSKSHLG